MCSVTRAADHVLHGVQRGVHGDGRGQHPAAEAGHGEPHDGRPHVPEGTAGPPHLRGTQCGGPGDPRLPHLGAAQLPHRQGGQGGDV